MEVYMRTKLYFVFPVLTIALLALSVTAAASVLSEQKKPKEPLDQITFIHYKDGKVKIAGAKAGPACYQLMGIKWKKFPINYVISPSIYANAVVAAANEWDSHTTTALFGSYTIDPSANFDASPDGRNEYSYGNYPQAGVIAVTSTWYTRFGKEIVEYDVMFDSDFAWGDAAKNPSLMDWQNIATHETGHGLGLSDIYNKACSAVTMYGYSYEGDVAKRTLEQADITGLRMIYGI